ncbi:TPA: type IV secretory system conjugative DNA transfer family protein [Salmonella enterica]
MEQNKIVPLLIFFFVLLLISIVGGAYLSSFIFLKMTHIDMSYLSYDTFYRYYEQYKGVQEFKKYIIAGWVGAVGPSVVPIFLLVMILVAMRKREELYGSASLASDMDLAKSNLFPPKEEIGKSKYPEILIGKMGKGRFKGQYLRFSGQQFVYIAAPTRSGKGVGVVIPNLLNYRDSVCALDIKFENFLYTGGFRKSVGQEVYLFSPAGFSFSAEQFEKLMNSESFKCLPPEEQESIKARFDNNELLRSHRWNPLSYIDRNLNFRDADINIIGKILFPSSGGDNDVWNELASNLFRGLVLYMLDNESSGMPVTMAQLLSLTAPEGGLNAWMQTEIDVAKKRGKPLSASCVSEFNRFMAAPEKTQGSILSNLTAPLAVFGGAACAAATSGDDFDLRDVRRRRMSIYLGIDPTQLDTYSKLINLFFSQLINVNTKTLPEQDPTLKFQCLLVLDEFTSMGRVGIIQKSIAYTAGYNIRYMIIIQTRGQLEDDKLYGKAGAQALIDNCAVQLIYPPKMVGEEAKLVSDTIGQKTVKVKNRSRSRSKGGSSVSDNNSEAARPVMMPQEVVDLGRIRYVSIRKEKTKSGKIKKTRQLTNIGIHEIIIMEQTKPFVADKIMYFDEEEFNSRKTFSVKNPVEIPYLKLKFESFTMPRPESNDVPKLKLS